MRLIKENIERDGSGFVTLYPDQSEDMWAAYNLIREGDLLRASAIRRVTTESATGSTSSQRVHITLTIRVRSQTFDPQAATLHVNGQIAAETQHAKLGQHHTLDLALHRNFTLTKEAGGDGGGGWDSVSRELVREACDRSKGASAWAVIMQEGVANIAVLMGERTVLRQRVSVSVPGKKGGEKAHAKAMEGFFATTLDALLRLLDLQNTPTAEQIPLLLASPGFTAQAFRDYIKDKAVRDNDKPLQNLVNKNVLVEHSSSGHLHSLSEVLASQGVKARLSDTKFARETQLMDRIGERLRGKDGGEDKVSYGPKPVERAVAAGAVGRGGGTLLISNELFRSNDVAQRKRWVALVDRVREKEGGEVRILSSEHESGRRLGALGGVAALLTFPFIDEEDDEDEDEDMDEGGIKVNGD